MFRFHVLSLAHTISNREFVACAYTQKVVKFCKMMTARGHHVIHYGHEYSEVDCAEHVTVLSNEVFQRVYGDHDYRKKFFTNDVEDEAYTTYDRNTIEEIGKRKKPGDFLLCFWGHGNKRIADAHTDMLIVEPGIGYASGSFARWKIYESYAIRSATNGPTHVAHCHEDWYHVVIPNYFDPDDFEFRKEKGDYFLFIGRIYSGKGVHIAIQVCATLGVKLIVAGQGSLTEMGFEEGPLLEYVGYADVEKRKELMAGAKAVFVPSLYNEPFGGVQIESLFSGTPTITTDWGAFSENNIHGITGYRCRTFDHFLWAAKNISKIDPQTCRDFAIENFSMNKVAEMYEEYFTTIHDVVFRKGWYEEHPERLDLSWLQRFKSISFKDNPEETEKKQTRYNFFRALK